MKQTKNMASALQETINRRRAGYVAAAAVALASLGSWGAAAQAKPESGGVESVRYSAVDRLRGGLAGYMASVLLGPAPPLIRLSSTDTTGDESRAVAAVFTNALWFETTLRPAAGVAGDGAPAPAMQALSDEPAPAVTARLRLDHTMEMPLWARNAATVHRAGRRS